MGSNFISSALTLFQKKGVFSLISYSLQRFKLYRLRKYFKFCGSLYLNNPYVIIGHKNITIGTKFVAGPGFKLEAINWYRNQQFRPLIEIGNNVILHDYVHIGCTNSVKIGNNVLMASKIYISDHNHGYYDDKHLTLHESPLIPPADRKISDDSFVIIEDNVWIGEFVSILPGSIIGKGAVIGSNSVVNSVIPPYSIAVGTPARVVKKYNFDQERWVKV